MTGAIARPSTTAPLARLALLAAVAALAGACSDGDRSEPADSGGDLAPDADAADDAGPDGEPELADLGGDAEPDATDADTDAGPRVLIDAANLVPPGEPLAVGQDIFLHGTFGTEVLGHWPPAEFMLQLLADEPEFWGEQFSNFGFVPDPGDDLPIGLKRGADDPARVHETCALCHVGALPDGRMWIGAPNGALDLEGFNVAVDARWVAAGNEPMMSELDRSKAITLGPGRTSAESSQYPQPVPADFPPYWDLDVRTALNYLGTGRELKTEAYFAIRAFGAGNPNAREATVPFPGPDVTGPLLEYMGSLRAPVGPTQDEALVARGAQVFEEARCGSCHHVADPSLNGITTVVRGEDAVERYPGDDPEYPNGSIATSPLHRVLQEGDAGTGGDAGYADLINFIVEHQLRVRQTDGYRVAPLQGIWATAPYLHNGSVPTLEDLLTRPEDRPATFQRHGFTVDTSVEGNGNYGHTFGTDLPDEDKTALIAWLRSL